MADRRLRYQVDVEGNAVENLDKLGRKSGSVARSMQDDLDKTASKGKQFAQVLGRMADDIEEDLEGSKRAAQALGRVLGDDLAGEADQIVASFNRAGLSFDEIEADAEELAAAFKRVEDVSQQMGGGIRAGADQAADGLDRVTTSGDQSRSVLANMAGNTAQDFGELGGVVGSLGVGIGQLAEYAVDGNIALKNLAAVAGPLALLSVAGLSLNAIMAENNKRIQRAREVQEAYTEALRDTEDAQAVLSTTAENFIDSDVISRVQRLGVNMRNLASSVTDASIDFGTINGPMREFLFETAEGSVSVQELTDAMDQFGVSASPLTEELMRLAAAGELDVGTLRDLTREIGELNTGYANSTDEIARTTAMNEALGTSVGDTAAEFDRATEGLDDYRQAMAEATDANNRLLDATNARADASLAAREATRQLEDAVQQANAATDEATTASNEIEAAWDNAAVAARNQAAAAVELATQQNGGAITAQQSAAIQIAEYQRISDSLAPGSPLRYYLAGYINDLEATNRTFTSTLELRVAQRNVGLDSPNPGLISSKGHASGGYAGTGTYASTDTIPTFLTPGEFVVNKKAADTLGSGALHAINDGHLPAVGVPVAEAGGVTIINNYAVTVSGVITEAQAGEVLIPAIKRFERVNGTAWRE